MIRTNKPQYRLLLEIFAELEQAKRDYKRDKYLFFPDLTFGEWLFGPTYLNGGKSA